MVSGVSGEAAWDKGVGLRTEQVARERLCEVSGTRV